MCTGIYIQVCGVCVCVLIYMLSIGIELDVLTGVCMCIELCINLCTDLCISLSICLSTDMCGICIGLKAFHWNCIEYCSWCVHRY